MLRFVMMSSQIPTLARGGGGVGVSIDKCISTAKSGKSRIQNPFLDSPKGTHPKSDWHQSSPCDIDALLNRVVMRITDMITQDEFA